MVAGDTFLDRIKQMLVKYTLELGVRRFAGHLLHRFVDPVDWREETYIGRAASYEEDLEPKIAAGFEALGFGREAVAGKHIVLKPNLVETSTDRSACINTHPRVMLGTIRALQALGAGSITVAEGAGHRRDSMILLEQSGLIDVLRATGTTFVDLNYADAGICENQGGTTAAKYFMLPRILTEADCVISMAKMKTHHWVGATLSMKNLYGTVPGVHYGWPKNVLHQLGIQPCIYDLTATVAPAFAIVEGIVGMEGDGPIRGTAKPAGVFVMGRNLPAVDATCCRVMSIDPLAIHYLAAAAYFLGPVDAERIVQKGAAIAEVETEFELPEHIFSYRKLLKQRRAQAKTEAKQGPRFDQENY